MTIEIKKNKWEFDYLEIRDETFNELPQEWKNYEGRIKVYNSNITIENCRGWGIYIYNGSKVNAINCEVVIGCDNSEVTAINCGDVVALDNSTLMATNCKEVWGYDVSRATAINCEQVWAWDSSTITATNCGDVIARDDSNVTHNGIKVENQ